MYLIKSIIDILIIILLLRLLIKPNEAYFNPIYRIIFRITDPILTPSTYVTKSAVTGVILTVLSLVVIRGLIYVAISKATIVIALGISFYDLVRFLFEAYMVLWFVSVLAQRSYGISFSNLIERAFVPVYRIAHRFGISRRRFHLFAFLFLLFAYTLLSTIIRLFIVQTSALSPFLVVQSLGGGLILILALFPFPGFFSLVIIAGALISWVSPDPSNPLVQAIYSISEPLLMPFRRFVPLLGGLDLSPIAALLVFQIVGAFGQQLVAGLLRVV